MRVEHESGFWVELTDRWTFGDKLAVRRATRDADYDPDMGAIEGLKRCIKAWSIDSPVTAAALENLDSYIADWLLERCDEVIAPPKVESSTSSPLSTAAAS